MTEKQQSDLKAGKTVYVSGMKDKEGKNFNAYIKVNTEEKKLDFFKWNPDKKQEAEVTPDEKHKTQVAVNCSVKLMLKWHIYWRRSPVRDGMLVENRSPVARQRPVRDVIGGKIIASLMGLGLREHSSFYQHLVPMGQKSEYQHLLTITPRFYEH